MRPVRRRRGESGSALLAVAVMGLLAMGVFALAWRSTHDAIRVERFTVLVERRAASVQTAVAQGVDLLQTGLPPTDPYLCVATIVQADQTYACTVMFSQAAPTGPWSIESWPATVDEQATLPALPVSF